MTERPIIFSGPMVRAILDGRKTQTRRLVKKGTLDDWNACPYGLVGGKLWVRENCLQRPLPNLLTGEPTNAMCAVYRADNEPVLTPDGFDLAWWYSRSTCPGIHMPRWASRITLEIVNVRIERLHEITEDDARAEGCLPVVHPEDGAVDCGTRKATFAKLWDSINAKRGHGWATNPWVWVLEFRRVDVL